MARQRPRVSSIRSWLQYPTGGPSSVYIYIYIFKLSLSLYIYIFKLSTRLITFFLSTRKRRLHPLCFPDYCIPWFLYEIHIIFENFIYTTKFGGLTRWPVVKNKYLFGRQSPEKLVGGLHWKESPCQSHWNFRQQWCPQLFEGCP